MRPSRRSAAGCLVSAEARCLQVGLLCGLLGALLAGCLGDGDGPPPAKPPSLGGAAPGTGRAPDQPCPSASLTPTGPSYAGRVVTGTLSGDHANADFRGATLDGATLSGNFKSSNFSGATVKGLTFFDGDFSGVCFKGLQWAAQGQLVFGGWSGVAVLDGADFSDTTVPAFGLLFGPSYPGTPVVMRNAVPNCEFLKSGLQADLSGARLSGIGVFNRNCIPDPNAVLHADYADFRGENLRGWSLAGWRVADADFQDALLDDTTGWALASLARANFRNASLRRVNFEGATITGSDFSYADLEASSFAGLKLLTEGGSRPTAFTGAHLKYANFSGATLTNVRFDFASLYGPVGEGTPAATCQTDTTRCPDTATGRTCACATMSGADLSGTNFRGAFLYGVDFSSSSGTPTAVSGTDFTNAVLVSANFQGALFSEDQDPNQGTRAISFDGALLQGAQFSADATLANASFDSAFVDTGYDRDGATRFVSSGLYWLVPADSARFAGWTGAAQPCVHLEYASPTTMPTAMGDNVCADGSSYADGCGAIVPRFTAQPLNPRWRPRDTLASRGGWYQKNATYEDKAPAHACNGTPTTPGW